MGNRALPWWWFGLLLWWSLLGGAVGASSAPPALNAGAARRFVQANANFSVPTIGLVAFECRACRTYYHPGYFTSHLGVDGSATPQLIVSVHACRAPANASAYVACAVERRGFPVSSHLLDALDARIAAFPEPLFHFGGVPSAVNGTSAMTSSGGSAAVDAADAGAATPKDVSGDAGDL